MRKPLLVLLVAVALGVSACSQRQAVQSPAGQSATGQAAAPAPAKSAVPGQSAASQAAATEQSSTDTDAQGSAPDTSLEHLAALPARAQLPQSSRWKPGVNYDPVVPAQPTDAPPGKVEVMEFFWFACPHCYALEPYLQSWLKKKPDYIDFVRIPIMWGPVHRMHARLYYTLQVLGRDDLDDKVFDTIHNGHNMLVGNTAQQSLDMELKWAQQQGIDADAFRKAYNSFTVHTDLQRAAQLMRRYHVDGVPFIAVDGKYTTDVGKAGGHPQLIQLINFLAASAKQRQR